MSLTKKVALNTSAQIAGRLISTAVSLVSVAVLSRYLGPATYGDYSIAFLYAAIASTIADVGIYTIGLREISSDPEKAERTAGTTILLKTFVQIPIFILFSLSILAFPYSETLKLAIIIGIFGATLGSIINSIALYFQYHLKLYYTVAVDVVIKIVSLFFVLWLVSKNAGFLQIVAANPASIAVGLGAAVLIFIALGYRVVWRFDRKLAFNILKDSWPLGVVTIIGYLHFKVDTVILSLLKSSYDVGIYSIAYRVIEVVIVLPGFFVASIFPVLSRYYSTKDPRLSTSIQRSFNFLAVIALPILFGVVATAPAIVNLIAGSQFSASATPMKILMFGALFSFMNTLFVHLAIIMNLQKRIIYVTTISLVANVTLNFLLIPLYGIIAAATVTVITEGIAFALTYGITKRHLKTPIGWKAFIYTALAGFIMFVVASVMLSANINLFIIIAASAVLYALLVIAFRVISIEEIRRLSI